MKRNGLVTIIMTALLYTHAALPLAAAQTDQGTTGQMVLGVGSVAGDGSGNCGGYGNLDLYLRQAKLVATENAKAQCLSRHAHRISSYEVRYRCGPWNTYLEVIAQANYRCL